VSIRELVQVSHTGKFRAFWRGEQHASVHLHAPDATCPYEHACDYGDNNRHMDVFDIYCLVQGFYRWDGTLHLDKRAGMRAARAEYPALQTESAPTVTGFQEIMTHQEAGKKGGRGHKARTNGTGCKRGNSAAYTLARLKRDRPDLYEQVQAGAKTAYAAAIEAGLRSRPPTVTGFTRSNRSRRQSKAPQDQSESSHREPVIIDRGAGGPGKQGEPHHPALRPGGAGPAGGAVAGRPGAEDR
jgi:hypothetical protein